MWQHGGGEIYAVEITEIERDILIQFSTSITLKLMGNEKECDSMRNSFISLVKRIAARYPNIVPGTGVASRDQVVFPIVAKSCHPEA